MRLQQLHQRLHPYFARPEAFQHALLFFFSIRRRHTRWPRDWSSDVCSSDLFSYRRREENAGSSFVNPEEVDRILELLAEFNEAIHLSDEPVTVQLLSGYAAQV